MAAAVATLHKNPKISDVVGGDENQFSPENVAPTANWPGGVGAGAALSVDDQKCPKAGPSRPKPKAATSCAVNGAISAAAAVTPAIKRFMILLPEREGRG